LFWECASDFPKFGKIEKKGAIIYLKNYSIIFINMGLLKNTFFQKELTMFVESQQKPKCDVQILFRKANDIYGFFK